MIEMAYRLLLFAVAKLSLNNHLSHRVKYVKWDQVFT